MLKEYNPTTPSLRLRRIVDQSTLYKGSPIKRLSRFKKSIDGKNHHGHTTIYHRGAGHRRLYRRLSDQFDEFRVLRIEYDPNRSSRIALVLHGDDQLSYVPCSDDMEVGQHRFGSKTLDQHNLWDKIYNLSIYPHQPQYIKAAGTSGILVGKNMSDGIAEVQLPSKEIIRVPISSTAVSGRVGNTLHQYERIGGAGYHRKQGRRPIVRGVAMNPVDHPHGGGEGKSSGGRPSCSPWGTLSKGKPTVKKNKKSRTWFRKVQ